ncbi:MAG: hypothetical protein MHM6MM_001662 [Cercozoa sp. M6MM]
MYDEEWAEFENEYHELSRQLGRHIGDLESGNAAQKRRAQIAAGDEQHELSELMQRMKVNMRAWPASSRRKYTQQYQVLQNDFDSMKKDLQRAKQRERQRDNVARAQYEDQRSDLLESEQLQDEQDSSLLRTQMHLARAEEEGTAAARRLVDQREQLVDAHGDLIEAEDSLDRARKTLMNMARRVVTDKIIQGVIIIIQLAIIALIAYFKWFRPSN